MTLSLVSVLDVQPHADSSTPDTFVGCARDSAFPRLFGGHVCAQALAAATRTVPAGLQLHSCHTYFLEPGRITEEVVYDVGRVRTTRSFATRQVLARQGDRVLATVLTSYHAPESGAIQATSMPSVATPDTLSPVDPDDPLQRRWLVEWPEWELRLVPAPPGRVRVWLRHREPVADLAARRCALAYAGDMTLASTSLSVLRRPLADHGLFVSSVDQAAYFFADRPIDQWLLHDQQATATGEGLYLGLGHLYAADGTLMCSFSSQTLVREPRH